MNNRPADVKKATDLGGRVAFGEAVATGRYGSDSTLPSQTMQARREFKRAADHWLLDAATYARDGELAKASHAANRALRALGRLRDLAGDVYAPAAQN